MLSATNDDRTTQHRAEEDYRTKLGFSRSLHGQGSLGYEVDAQVMLGQNVMREETGFFGSWEGTRYNLDKATQDLLIAHTRQDVAATHGMATAALRQAFRTRRMAEVVFWLVAFLVAMNIATLGLLLALWVRG